MKVTEGVVVNDLISRQSALYEIDKNRLNLLSLGLNGAEDVLVHYGRRVIEKLPAITHMKNGYWMSHPTDPDKQVCSVCRRATQTRIHYNEGVYGGYDIEYIYSFCPYCGAKLKRTEGSEK